MDSERNETRLVSASIGDLSAITINPLTLEVTNLLDAVQYDMSGDRSGKVAPETAQTVTLIAKNSDRLQTRIHNLTHDEGNLHILHLTDGAVDRLPHTLELTEDRSQAVATINTEELTTLLRSKLTDAARIYSKLEISQALNDLITKDLRDKRQSKIDREPKIIKANTLLYSLREHISESTDPTKRDDYKLPILIPILKKGLDHVKNISRASTRHSSPTACFPE